MKGEWFRIMQIYSNTVTNKNAPANQIKQEFAGNNAFLNNKNVNFTGGMPKVTEAIEKFGEDFGKAAGKHFKEIIEQAKRSENSGLKINADDIATFKDQPFSQRAWEILSYPITGMPIDLANGVINGLKKIPWFKNSSGLNGLSAKPIFKNRMEFVENKSHVAAIKHYFELLAEGDGEKEYLNRFLKGHTRLAPLMLNYNSEAERSLNRLVTGLIPAFFLANDAYNLSIYMKNNKDDAKKEKKRRFNQEVVRIGITTAATFYLMGIFAKQCNKSMYLTAGLTAGMVLVSEIMGRLIAGNPVLPVSVQKAKEYAQKRNQFKQKEQISGSKDDKTSFNKPAQKGFLTLSNILKVFAGLVAFGFAAEKISNIPKISKRLGKFNDWYKGLFTEEYKIQRSDFDRLMNKLSENNNFSEMADFYKMIVDKQQGETLTIGHIENRKKYILIHQILSFPVRFIKDVIMLPYKDIVKPMSKIVKEKILKIKGEDIPKNLNKYKSIFEDSKDIKMLQNSVSFLGKIEKDSNLEFTKKVNEKLISSFDNLTKSNYKNSDLNVIVKTTASAVTTGFLIADNYNMVMIDSQGEDKGLAKQKAKERAMQRAARLTYEAFILKLVLDIFAVPCSTSLLVSLAVSGILRVITEMVERKAVGLPLHESTREEMKENETKHLNATGLKGAYFRIMAMLTGKKTFAEKQKKQ